jgi:hypothetical protein
MHTESAKLNASTIPANNALLQLAMAHTAMLANGMH